MYININAWRYRLQRLTGLTGIRLADACSDRVLLHPAEKTTRPPAVYSQSMLSRVRAVQAETSLGNEWQRIGGGRVSHGATEAFLLRHIRLDYGYLYGRHTRLVVTPQKERFFLEDTPCHFQKAALASSYQGNRYFGHWLSDDGSRAFACQPFGSTLFTALAETPHQRDYLKAFGLDSHHVNSAWVDELTVIADQGQNAFKRQRYGAMRKKIQAFAGPPLRNAQTQGHRVFLKRGLTGQTRMLVNEAELESFLGREGFICVDVGASSLREIIAKTRGASLVVGMEGSHLMHGLFSMNRKGSLLVIQPPDRFNNVLKDIADAMGIGYGFLVCDGGDGRYRQSLREMGKAIDMMVHWRPIWSAVG